MSKLIFLTLFVLVAWAAWHWFFVRNRPELLPLAIEDDDQLMINARQRAKDTIPQMIALFQHAKDSTQVKIPFVTSSGMTEHLWAELLSIDGSRMNVRYTTPPVTHSGRLERLHTHDLTDIEDWLVSMDSGKLVGGFTMRVMFQRGRELWGDLPQKLRDEEAKYGIDDV